LQTDQPQSGSEVAAFEMSERARSYSPEIFRSPSKSVSADSLFIPVSHPPVSPDSAFAKPLKLSEIQQQLDPDTVLLEYLFGEKQTYLWFVLAHGIETHILPDSPPVIDAKAREFYDLLTSPIGRVRPQETAKVGKQLSQMLLGPIAQKLRGQRLLIVGDGVLQYVPFAALPNPTPIETSQTTGEFARHMQPLLVEHEVVTLPSASTLAAIRHKRANRPPARKEMAVFADPVFNRQDERYQALLKSAQVELPVKAESSAIPADFEAMYPRLQGSRQEAEGILKSVPPGKQTSTYLGFDANLQNALSPELAQYRIIHFATHGMFNTKSPQRSGLVLSTFADGTQPEPISPKLFKGQSDRILSALDKTGALRRGLLSPTNAFDMKLASADLVVLSDCRTGLGQNIRGEGLVGLTGGLMAAGAERVVVSLWSVQDTATTKLMTDFYQRMLDSKHPQYTPSPAKALRAAQLAMWNDPQWQTPYYWAAFTIQGEWQ
jgi:CHAT domain-containing protein